MPKASSKQPKERDLTKWILNSKENMAIVLMKTSNDKSMSLMTQFVGPRQSVFWDIAQPSGSMCHWRWPQEQTEFFQDAQDPFPDTAVDTPHLEVGTRISSSSILVQQVSKQFFGLGWDAKIAHEPYPIKVKTFFHKVTHMSIQPLCQDRTSEAEDGDATSQKKACLNHLKSTWSTCGVRGVFFIYSSTLLSNCFHGRSKAKLTREWMLSMQACAVFAPPRELAED